MSRINATPRISVNKLGEYIVSRPNRQSQIIRGQKYPPDYIVTYYKDAQETIGQFFANNLDDISILERTIQNLDQSPAENVYQVRRSNGNIQAIEKFMEMIDDVNLHGGVPQLGESRPERLTVRNVEVSVRPEIIMTGTDRRGRNVVGGVKLHFPTTSPLNDDSAGFVSAVVQEYCRACLADIGEPYHHYSFVVDVASARIYPGVQSTRRRMQEVEAACEQIFNLWPTVTN